MLWQAAAKWKVEREDRSLLAGSVIGSVVGLVLVVVCW